MPTYEYQCRDCGGQFEYFQSISEPPKEKCEKCGGSLTKLLSAGTGLIFKGSGFYITDYKGSGSTGSASGEKKSSGGEGTKSESKGSDSSPSASSSGTKSGDSSK